MTIHTALAAQRATTFAGGLPLALVGDWNFKPDGPEYRFMTTGLIAEDSPAMPLYKDHDPWRITDGFLPFRSAYVRAFA
jgi:endonuclease/exonuclease/phosphatase family metal-dependent hydrolase